jgi:hypothetical protein
VLVVLSTSTSTVTGTSGSAKSSFPNFNRRLFRRCRKTRALPYGIADCVVGERMPKRL